MREPLTEFFALVISIKYPKVDILIVTMNHVRNVKRESMRRLILVNSVYACESYCEYRMFVKTVEYSYKCMCIVISFYH